MLAASGQEDAAASDGGQLPALGALQVNSAEQENVACDVEEFLTRNGIDKAAAEALKELMPDQQKEVISEELKEVKNPSAVLISRIRRIKGGPKAGQRRRWRRGGKRLKADGPSLLDGLQDKVEEKVEEFLERHGINADSCQSLWEMSPSQQQQVISTALDTSIDAYDALMSRISQVMEDKHCQTTPGGNSSHQSSSDTFPVQDEVEDFLKRNGIGAEGCQALQEMSLEQQREVIAEDLTGAKKPTAVLLSRIRNVKAGRPASPGQPAGRTSEADAFLRRWGFDKDACSAFSELSPDAQQQVMAEDFSRCRNASAMLMSRMRDATQPESASGSPAGRRSDRRHHNESSNPKGFSISDKVEDYLRSHGIDEGGSEALRQLPPRLQESVMAHNLSQGRSPSQRLASLVSMAWSGRLQPPDRIKQEPNLHEAVEEFLAQHEIDEQSRKALLELPDSLQQAVLDEGEIKNCRNPSAVLISRIGRARRNIRAKNGKDSAGTDDRQWNADISFPPPPEGPPPPHLIQNREGSDARSSQTSKDRFTDCRPLVKEELTDFRDAPRASKRALVAPVGLADPEEHAAKRYRTEGKDAVNFELAVEGFLRLNGIDLKCSRSFRQLPRSRQSDLMKVDLRKCRNPSQLLWSHVQRAQREAEDVNAGRSSTREGRSRDAGEVAFSLVRCGGGDSVPAVVDITADSDPLTCGRAPHCTVVLKVQHVSKIHAELHPQRTASGEHVLMLHDVSSNGMWVDGHKVQPRRFMQLQPGDRISFLPPEMSPGADVPTYELVKGKSSGPIGRMSPVRPVQAYHSRGDQSRRIDRELHERGASQQGKTDSWNHKFSSAPDYPSHMMMNPRSFGGEAGHALQLMDRNHPEVQETAALEAGDSTDVASWIRSVGSGGKLSDRVMAEIEDTYDNLAQIFNNYGQHIDDFYDSHEVVDPDEQDVLLEAVRSLSHLVGDH
mmetsp:Transcript_23718/g.42972  ORF Transcript_23718/g.42972 Transcript_23718/m.42972 type:complete len:953 (+) Transcript_23718:111-2969(+)